MTIFKLFLINCFGHAKGKPISVFHFADSMIDFYLEGSCSKSLLYPVESVKVAIPNRSESSNATDYTHTLLTELTISTGINHQFRYNFVGLYSIPLIIPGVFC